MADTYTIVGWDIGGVNTKAVALTWTGSGPPTAHTAGRYFEVWRDLPRLPDVLRAVADELGSRAADAPLALTLTAELSDIFRTKSEGVLCVLDAVRAAFPHAPAHALRLDERFVPLHEARGTPGAFAAANWLAGALYIAAAHGTCLWIDAGSTTTDIIPIVAGRVAVEGRTDPARLTSGELVYTGVQRTPLGAVASGVPLRGRPCRTAPELFATMADVHLALGHITADAYTTPTADGRPTTVEAALERISRAVCADGETISAGEARALARAFSEAQLSALTCAALQVLSRFADGPLLPVLASGSGAFLGRAVAARLGLPLLEGGDALPAHVAEVLPCYAAAWLLERHLRVAVS